MTRGALAALLLVAAACSSKTKEPSADSGVATNVVTSSTSTTAKPPVSLGAGLVSLPPGSEQLGVRRSLVRVVRPGPSAEDPAVAVMADGKILVAFAVRDGPREMIAVRRAPAPGAPLNPPRRFTQGSRGWHPQLTVTSSGAVWLTWCGRDGMVKRGDHRRSVYAKRIAPVPGNRIEISAPRASPRDDRRYCDPDTYPAAGGGFHVVWESSRATSTLSSRVMYRRVFEDGRLSDLEEVSSGPFDRRPRVAASKDGRIWVAWDRWVDDKPTGARDPNYDLYLRTKTATSAFSAPLALDEDVGIQAAPSLAIDPEGRLLVAYHTSQRHGLVKWWTLRRVSSDRTIEILAALDPGEALLPSGQQQGAELPEIAVEPSGRIVLATRVSHGTYLHVVDKRGILPALDLTRRGWGARGVKMDMTFAPDGSLLIARRARHDVVLERLTLSDEGRGPPEFEPLLAPLAKRRRTIAPKPVVLDGRVHKSLDKARVVFGDVHMHSAVSDGTGPPDEIIARAYARGLDFAVLTDHDYVVGARMMLSEHDEIQWLTDVFDARDDFVAIHGYEWTTLPLPRGSGHKNVYFREHGPSPLIGSRRRAPGTRALQRALAEEDAFTAPHHTGWTGTDWDKADPRIQRHVEIVSVHGAFEDPRTQPIPTRAAKRGMFAVDGLKRGNRFGFIGGSDAHGILWHHGVGRRMDPWGHGLTGVIVDRIARTDVWDAIYARRTFATSGARMTVVTAIGDATQGGQLPTKAPVTLRWHGRGTIPIEELVVVRDGVIVYRQAVSSHETDGRYIDETVTPGRHSYYVRLQQGVGLQTTDLAWSSPIFVTIEP